MIARRDVLAGLVALSGPTRAAAAGAVSYRAPRTAHGAPDLQGMWSNASGTPLERAGAFKSLVISETEAQAFERSQRKVIHGIPGDDVGQDQAEWFEPDPPLARVRGEVRTSVIVDPPDGRLPYSPAGRGALGARLGQMGDFDGPEVRPVFERCLMGFGYPAGAPLLYTPQTGSACQFLQTRDFLVVRAEANHDVRIISLGPDAPPPQPARPWMGVSTGRWEGETLVVETTRFNPEESVRSLPYLLYLSPDAKVVERFTRTSPSEIFYDFSVEDPAAFTRVWRGELAFRKSRDPIYEYACHEGNYSLPNILAGARRAEGR
jgi:hypothetical protein